MLSPLSSGPGGASEGPLDAYSRAVRARPALVLAAVLAAFLGSLAWIAVRSPEYHATARLLIEPVSSDDEALLGLPLVRDAGDPTRTAQTAAALLHNPRAAEDAAQRLGGAATATSVLGAVTVEPAGQSNILAVTALAADAEEAVRIADAFATATVKDRDALLRLALEGGAGAGPQAIAADAAAERASRLAVLERTGDPTVALADPAVPPSSPSGAPGWLLLAVGLLAGAIVGAVAAVVAELRAPRRVADEEELLALLPGPILARLPEAWHRFSAGSDAGYLTPADVAFRSLQVQLGLLDGAGRVVMVSSPDAGDGKTTLLASLALRLAAEGQSVVAMDLDLHAPVLAHVLAVRPEPGLAAALEPGGTLADALTLVSGVPGLHVVPGLHDDRLAALARARQCLPELIAQARASGSHVLIDTSPLGTVGDAILLLDGVDELVVVARLGHTTTAAVEATRDALWRADRAPSGLAVICTGSATVLPTRWAPGWPWREAGDDEAAFRATLPAVEIEFATGDRVRWRRGAAHGTGIVERVLPDAERRNAGGDGNGGLLEDRRYRVRTDTTGKVLTCRAGALRRAEDDD